MTKNQENTLCRNAAKNYKMELKQSFENTAILSFICSFCILLITICVNVSEISICAIFAIIIYLLNLSIIYFVNKRAFKAFANLINERDYEIVQREDGLYIQIPNTDVFVSTNNMPI